MNNNTPAVFLFLQAYGVLSLNYLSLFKDILGEEVFALLDDKTIIEVSINADTRVFFERLGHKPEYLCDLEPNKTEQLLRLCASGNDKIITKESPILSTRIPHFGHRIEGIIPPIVENATASIRLHDDREITFASYFSNEEDKNNLSRMLFDRKNILIAGATKSGKTTFLNACLHEISEVCPAHRIIIIEDTVELRQHNFNTQRMLVNEEVSITEARLLQSTLRQAPDRIIIGEVRNGGAALNMLKAWNTGHPGGLSSIHADSAGDVFPRLEDLLGEVYLGATERLMKASVDCIIFLELGLTQPGILEILSVGDAMSNFEIKTIYKR